jgi:hypothetical protein
MPLEPVEVPSVGGTGAGGVFGRSLTDREAMGPMAASVFSSVLSSAAVLSGAGLRAGPAARSRWAAMSGRSCVIVRGSSGLWRPRARAVLRFQMADAVSAGM